MLLYQNQFIGTYNNNKIIEFNNALPGFWAFDYTVAGNPCGSGGATTSVVQVKKSCYSDDTVEYCTGDGATYNVESLLRDSYSGTCTSYYTGGTFTDNSGWGAGFNSTTGAFTPSSAPSPGTYSFSYDPSSDSSFPSAGFTVQSGCENCKMDLTVVVTQSYTAGISSRDHASPVIYDKLSGAAALLPHLYLSARDTSIASNPRWVYDGNDPAEIDTVLAGPTSGLQTTLTNVGADDLLYAGANMSINF